MAADRDLAVAFVRARFPTGTRDRTAWDVTAATGARGLRLLHEGERFGRVVLTESHPDAYRVLAANARPYPGALAVLADGRTPIEAGAFDYVDIDPYGTPVPFVPAALAAVRPGGVIAVTATDLMVLAGVQPGACERRYGARPIRGRLGPESGLRILLAFLVRKAAEGGRALRPLLAYVRDHHVRAYVEVGGRPVPSGAEAVGVLDPARFDGPPLEPGGPYGPMWLGPLFDAPLVRSLEVPPRAARPEEVEKFLERLREETDADRPFYYEPNLLARRLGLAHPPSREAIRASLTAAGFSATRTHARPEGFRTTAPRSTVEDRVRAIAADQSQKARVRA